MTLTPARRVARAVISDVRERTAWSHELLSHRLGRETLSPADRALATRLVYGTVSAEGTLDEALDRYITRPSRVHPAVRDALRMAAYEILFMRTPAHVAVHQGVEGVRAVNGAAAGLANAVLRRLADSADTFPWGDPDADFAALARLTAHPLWIAELLVADLGSAKAHEIMRASLDPAPLYLAHNPFRTSMEALLETLTEEGAEPRLTGPPGCIEAGVPSAAVRSTALEQGLCVVADAGSQYVAALAGQVPGGVVVDLAAGRGTKTMLLQAAALRAGAPATVVAGDVHPFKTELLTQRMSVLGVPAVRSVVADAAHSSAIESLGGHSSADVVLVDAPCSGLGTLRRHPEKRWRLNPEDIPVLASLAASLLSTAAHLVRPGGFVVYSTCTITRRENAEVIDGFLASEGGEGFESIDLADTLPLGWDCYMQPGGRFASYPHSGGPDGHFAAVLRRA